MAKTIYNSPFERAAKEGLIGGSNAGSTHKPDNTPKNGEWIETFLSAIMQGSSVLHATTVAGVHITLPYKSRTSNEAFAKAWKEAAEIGTDLMEQEAARRAYHGTLKPVFHKGEQCGFVREYSDTLMMFLLKGRRPEVYRDNVEEGLASGRGSCVININVETREPTNLIDRLIEVVAIGTQSNKQDGTGLPEATSVSGEPGTT